MNHAIQISIDEIKKLKKPVVKVTAGQPKKFDFYEMRDKIVKYFEHCNRDDVDEDLTITGLAAVCGFYGRMQLYEYMKYPEFSDLIKSARNVVEGGYEKDLRRNSTSGIIFALKQFGWTDAVENNVKINNEDPEQLKKEIAGLLKSEGLD